jgi:hypothetical protein
MFSENTAAFFKMRNDKASDVVPMLGLNHGALEEEHQLNNSPEESFDNPFDDPFDNSDNFIIVSDVYKLKLEQWEDKTRTSIDEINKFIIGFNADLKQQKIKVFGEDLQIIQLGARMRILVQSKNSLVQTLQSFPKASNQKEKELVETMYSKYVELVKKIISDIGKISDQVAKLKDRVETDHKLYDITGEQRTRGDGWKRNLKEGIKEEDSDNPFNSQQTQTQTQTQIQNNYLFQEEQEQLAYEQAIEELAQDIHLINGMFQDFSALVQQQNFMVDQIVQHVENASKDIERGNVELGQAKKYQTCGTKIKLYIICGLVVLLIFLACFFSTSYALNHRNQWMAHNQTNHLSCK